MDAWEPGEPDGVMADMSHLPLADGAVDLTVAGAAVPAARSSMADHDTRVTSAGDEPVGRTKALVQRFHAWREDLRSNPKHHRIYKISVGVVGGVIVVGGLALVPLPGPGWLIVFLGLAILASEFESADRVQRFAKAKVHAWTVWLGRQNLFVRLAVGLATFAFVLGVVYGLAVLTGVPSWVPQWMVPPLPGLEQ